jgi:hypothetical protein
MPIHLDERQVWTPDKLGTGGGGGAGELNHNGYASAVQACISWTMSG